MSGTGLAAGAIIIIIMRHVHRLRSRLTESARNPWRMAALTLLITAVVLHNVVQQVNMVAGVWFFLASAIGILLGRWRALPLAFIPLLLTALIRLPQAWFAGLLSIGDIQAYHIRLVLYVALAYSILPGLIGMAFGVFLHRLILRVF